MSLASLGNSMLGAPRSFDVYRTHSVVGFKVLGGVPDVQNSHITVMGVVKVELSKAIPILGQILNDHGSVFMKVCGAVPVLSFVASVPRRLQQYVSDKVWYK